MDKTKYIYKVVLNLNGVPKLYRSLVIKETPTAFLCEADSIATNYESCVYKRYAPSMSAKRAWKRYIQGVKSVRRISLQKVADTTEILEIASRELAALTPKTGLEIM